MPSVLASHRPAVLLILAAASWGVGTAISKVALAEMPALTLLVVQLLSSVAALVVALRLQGRPLRDREASPILGRLGLLNPGLAYALSLIGLASISASLAVLLWALEPLFILALAAVALRERITRSLVGLSLVAVAGMVLVIGGAGGSSHWIGIGLTVAGIACCAVYTIVARRTIGTTDATAQVVLAQQAWAALLAIGLLAGAQVLGVPLGLSGISGLGLLSAVGSGLLYYAAAYLLYLTALRAVPASQASAAFYLIPVFGVAAGVGLLGERLEPSQWLGAVVVVAAVTAILREQAAEGRTGLVASGASPG